MDRKTFDSAEVRTEVQHSVVKNSEAESQPVSASQGAAESNGRAESGNSARRRKRSAIVDINSAGFDPNTPELTTTWSTNASVICCVNSYPNGITVSLHSSKRNQHAEPELADADESRLADGDEDVQRLERPARKFSPNQFHLRFRDTRDYQLPEGKFLVYRDNALRSLEKHLVVLHQKGLLATTVLYFGTTADPFLAYHKKFDVTSGCLELFEKYRPGTLVVQTRSPMIVSALPALRRMRESSVVVLPVETHLEKVVAHYTPGQPRIAERLVAAEGLRRQGVRVNLAVSPVLPYGDFYRDAWDFAEILERHADFITFGCLASGTESDERQLKSLPIARRLTADKEFRWLRPHAYRYVYHAMSVLAPQKLILPVSQQKSSGQLSLFAA